MIQLIQVYQILKYYGGGNQDSGLALWDQVVKIGEEWLEQRALVSWGGIAKWVKYPTGYLLYTLSVARVSTMAQKRSKTQQNAIKRSKTQQKRTLKLDM